MGQLGSGMSGQAALAGLQERAQAANQLGGLLGQMRGQDLQAALGGMGLQLGGLGDIERARTGRFGALMGNPTGTEALTSGLLGGLSLIPGLG
jgi:hypothetical protein